MKLQCQTEMVDSCHVSVKAYRMYSKHVVKLNYRIWIMILCYCISISFNQCTGLVGEGDGTEAVKSRGAGTMGEIWVPSAQFCCGSKAAFKSHLAFKR